MKNIGKNFMVSALFIGLSGSFVYADVFTDLKTSFKSSFPRTTTALNQVNGFVQNKLPAIKFSSYSDGLSGGFAKFAKIESPTRIASGLVAPLSPILKSGVQVGQSVYTSLKDNYNSLSSINLKSYSQHINSGITKLAQFASPIRIATGLTAPFSTVLKSGVQYGQGLYTSLNNRYNSFVSISLPSYSQDINSRITKLTQYASPTRIVAGLTTSLSPALQYRTQLGQSLRTSLNDNYTKLNNFNLKGYTNKLVNLANFNSSPSLNIAMKGLFAPLASSLKYSSSVGKGFSNSFNGTDPLKLAKVTQIR